MIILDSVSDETLSFMITSSSRNTIHDVYCDIDDGWLCTCEHHYYRKVSCKHMRECKDGLINNNLIIGTYDGRVKQNNSFTIVAVSVNGVYEYTPERIRYLINLASFAEIKKHEEHLQQATSNEEVVV